MDLTVSSSAKLHCSNKAQFTYSFGGMTKLLTCEDSIAWWQTVEFCVEDSSGRKDVWVISPKSEWAYVRHPLKLVQAWAIRVKLELKKSSAQEFVFPHIKMSMFVGEEELSGSTVERWASTATLQECHSTVMEAIRRSQDNDDVRVVVELETYTPVVSTPVVVSEPAVVTTCAGLCNRLSSPPDFHLVCEGREFHVHKLVLAGRSDVFRKMLEIPMSESAAGEGVISDASALLLEKVLEYFYTGKLRVPVDTCDMLELMNFAEKYNLEDVKVKCSKGMLDRLNEDNVAEFMHAALKFNLDDKVIKDLKKFAKDHHGALLKNPTYRKLLSENVEWFAE